MRAKDVTIISACRNREHVLARSLPSWLALQVAEIIIVDWGSKPRLKVETQTLTSGFTKITIVRVQDIGRWILSLALNFAASHVRTLYILKLDVDYVLGANFLQKHPLNDKPRCFWAGNWRQARNENERHLNGLLFVSRSHFEQVGGFNEYVRGYGYDDTDLYNRLQQIAKLEMCFIDNDTVHHIEHPHLNQQLNIFTNMYLCKRLPWDAQRLACG